MSKLELQIDEKGLKVNKSRIIREISALYIKEGFNRVVVITNHICVIKERFMLRPKVFAYNH